MARHILLVGGGSGGHVYPLIAVARALKEKAKGNNRNIKIRIMGDGDFLRRAAQDEGILFTSVMSGKMRRYLSPKTLLDIIKIPFGLIQAIWNMFWIMPHVVFAKGGHASVLPVLAARLFFIPVYLHETDSVPGLANRLMSSRARKIFVSFASSLGSFNSKKTEVVGNPVRKELFKGDRNQALNRLNLSPDKKTILIIGGSQGAQSINMAVMASLVQIVESGFQVVHQCGEANLSSVRMEADKLIKEGGDTYGSLIANQYRLFGFFDDAGMADAYAVADLVISRSGGVIFELAMLGKPVILIPFPHAAADHQLKNALEFVEYGAVMLEEENLTPHIIINTIKSLSDPQVYGSICQKIKSFAKPDAAERIADELL